ncbi:MAG: hypothetical protein JSR37_07690 [Verrucomicrobia bacterium]|nr:hypothetical protein [Verrucomicrobiota bacterium]MBS0636450.1 hypothetical protein [Verrucomicrobiota bacterium]
MNFLSLSFLPAAYSALVPVREPKKHCDPAAVKAAYERISQVARNFMDGKIAITQGNFGIPSADLGAQWHKDMAFVDACEGKFLKCVEEEVAKPAAKVVTHVVTKVVPIQSSSLFTPLTRIVDAIGVPATVAIGVVTLTCVGYGIYKLSCAKKLPDVN